LAAYGILAAYGKLAALENWLAAFGSTKPMKPDRM